MYVSFILSDRVLSLQRPFTNMKYLTEPWLVWLSELSTGLQTKRSLVQFPGRAHAWVEGWPPAGDGQGATDQWFFPSLSTFLLLFLKINS